MLLPDETTGALRDRDELWDAAPGLVGLRGPALRLFRRLDARIAALAAGETPDEWRVPPAIALSTLARAGYFASFPQWLTVASHLSADEEVLARVAAADDPAAAATAALAPAGAALAPAVCYHTYAALAGRTLRAPRLMTAQATCWRHEGDRLAPLERNWAFTMREIVCIGDATTCEAFRQRGIRQALALARALELDADVDVAADPFFAPTARGRALLQRIKALKHELLLPIGGGRRTAAASFNNHETFFGEAFDIRLADGTPASSACVAFGLERWLLAVLAARGPSGLALTQPHESVAFTEHLIPDLRSP